MNNRFFNSGQMRESCFECYSRLLIDDTLLQNTDNETTLRTTDAEVLMPGSGDSVTIVHYVMNNAFHEILSGGLKCREQLATEGKAFRLNHLDDYNFNIYFRPPFKRQKSSDISFIEAHRTHPTEWIAIDVNPANTYVYDGNYRVSNDSFGYYASRTRLQDLFDKPKSGSWEVIIQRNVIKPQWFSCNSLMFKHEHRHDSDEDQKRFDSSFGLTKI